MQALVTTIKRIGAVRLWAIGLFIVFFGLLYAMQPPQLFPSDTIVTIRSGESLTEISHDFKNQHIIHSTLLFRIVVLAVGSERNIVAGEYLLDKPLSLLDLIRRLRSGNFNLKSEKVTIPEGSSVRQIADILSATFPRFDHDQFVSKAQSLEGYLFPETYFFLPSVKSDEVIKTMRTTFDSQLASSTDLISSSTHSLNDIIIIASILEREAKTAKDWGIISGILWKRLANNMPLQVDATSNYYLGKTSAAMTVSDLKDDSPYNTYTHKGLPPTPIANPGLETILAALNPVKTPYWYYLSDTSNVIHYARTYDEHLRNRTVYLNK